MSLTPETDFLLGCARRFAGTVSPEELRGGASRISDWRAAIDLARAHWMEPLAAWYLDEDCADILPPEIREGVRAAMRRSAANLLSLSADLIKVLRVLNAHSIPVVPKGPVLATMLCDEMAWRESCDLDLLIRRADITRAKDALMAAWLSARFPASMRRVEGYLLVSEVADTRID